MKPYALSLMFVVVALAIISLPSFVRAQAPVKFSDPSRVAQAMDNNPRAVMEILCEHITQVQADAIEADLFPAPTDAEKRGRLEKARILLGRTGGVGGKAIAEIDAELAKIPEAPQEVAR